MNISFPTDTSDVITAIRGAIGREITFYTNTPITCSACSLEPVTRTSTNPYCPVCSGVYFIPSYSGTTMLAHVTWGVADNFNWVTGGQYFDGDGRVQIKLTDETRTLVKAIEYMMIDGKKCIVKNVIFRGVPALNRILVDFIEEE